MKRWQGLRWRTLLWRWTGFLALWWVLAEGELYRPWIGALIAAAATASSLYAWPRRPPHWQPRALLSFIPYFLWRSFLGGMDVARRALTPAPVGNPRLEQVTVRLQGQAARAFLVWAITMFPGTASVQLRGERLEVHVLDRGFLSEAGLRELEARVAAVFDEPLPPHDGRPGEAAGSGPIDH